MADGSEAEANDVKKRAELLRSPHLLLPAVDNPLPDLLLRLPPEEEVEEAED